MTSHLHDDRRVALQARDVQWDWTGLPLHFLGDAPVSTHIANSGRGRRLARGGGVHHDRCLTGPAASRLRLKCKDAAPGSGVQVADLGGFEPPRALTQHGFQPCAIGH